MKYFSLANLKNNRNASDAFGVAFHTTLIN